MTSLIVYFSLCLCPFLTSVWGSGFVNDSCFACGASVGVSHGVVGNGNGTENDSSVDAGLCHGLWETYCDFVYVGEINAMYKII